MVLCYMIIMLQRCPVNVHFQNYRALGRKGVGVFVRSFLGVAGGGKLTAFVLVNFGIAERQEAQRV